MGYLVLLAVIFAALMCNHSSVTNLFVLTEIIRINKY